METLMLFKILSRGSVCEMSISLQWNLCYSIRMISVASAYSVICLCCHVVFSQRIILFSSGVLHGRPIHRGNSGSTLIRVLMDTYANQSNDVSGKINKPRPKGFSHDKLDPHAVTKHNTKTSFSTNLLGSSLYHRSHFVDSFFPGLLPLRFLSLTPNFFFLPFLSTFFVVRPFFPSTNSLPSNILKIVVPLIFSGACPVSTDPSNCFFCFQYLWFSGSHLRWPI